MTGTNPPDVKPILQAQNLLGEPLWRFLSQTDFPMTARPGWTVLLNGWISPIKLRDGHGDAVDPEVIAESTFGPLLSKETKETLARAESRPQALALLLMAPEFQRR